MNEKSKVIPKFTTETAERKFWETHDSTDYVDWRQAERVALPNLKPTTKTISLRLPKHLLDSIKVAAAGIQGQINERRTKPSVIPAQAGIQGN